MAELNSFLLRAGWSFGSNSLEDMRHAIVNVTPHLEMDFLETSDGRLIAAHDDADIAPAGQRVCNLPSTFDFRNRNGKAPPFLEDALRALGTNGTLFIDLTTSRAGSSEVVDVAANAVIRLGMQDRTIIGTYTIDPSTSARLHRAGLHICLKFDSTLTLKQSYKFGNKALASRSRSICLLSQNYSEFILDICLQGNIFPILAIWEPFDQVKDVIENLHRKGVRHFISPYPQRITGLLA